MILSAVYHHRHTRGIVRWLICGWFGLIGVSTVLTYQHHVIDLAGGFLLGLLCYYLIPNRSTPQPLAMNVRIDCSPPHQRRWRGRNMGAAVGTRVSLACVVTRDWRAVLRSVCRHHSEREWQAVTHCPDRAGALLAAVRIADLRRRADAWNVVAPNVVIGRHLRNVKPERHEPGVTAVLDLTSEFCEPGAFLALPYLNLPVLDLTAPTPEQLSAALNFINAHREAGIVYVHCRLVTRSAPQSSGLAHGDRYRGH
jgi:hypothetical protein